MKTFAEKIIALRSERQLNQTQFGELIGVSLRTVTSYETQEKKPRMASVIRMAKILGVSVKYLTDDNCDNPLEDIGRDGYKEEASERFGVAGVRDIDRLLDANAALFAGGELSQEQKDAYFEAIMKCYLTAKEAAKEKFGKKNRDK